MLGLDSQIKGMQAGEAKPGALVLLPPAAGSGASSKEKSHPKYARNCPDPGKETQAWHLAQYGYLRKEKQSLAVPS